MGTGGIEEEGIITEEVGKTGISGIIINQEVDIILEVIGPGQDHDLVEDLDHILAQGQEVAVVHDLMTRNEEVEADHTVGQIGVDLDPSPDQNQEVLHREKKKMTVQHEMIPK